MSSEYPGAGNLEFCPPSYVERILGGLRLDSTENGAYADCFCEATWGERWDWEDGGVAHYMVASREGLALRLLTAGRSFMATRTRLDEEALREAARQLSLASGNQPFLKKSTAHGASAPAPPSLVGGRPPYLDSVAARLTEAGVERLGLRLERIVRRTRTYRVSGPSPAAESERWLLTITALAYSAGSMAGEELRRDYALAGWSQGIAHRCARDAAQTWSEPAQPLERTGVQNVVFAAGTAAIFFHEALGHLLEADYVRRGASPLGRYLDATLTRAPLTILDDPSHASLIGGTAVDDEGYPARPRVLLDRGRLAGFLADIDTVRACGASYHAGNARRAAFTDLPLPRMSNLVVAPGESAAEDLASGIAEGMWIDELSGGHVEVTSGQFHFPHAVGRRIRGGQPRPGRVRCALAGDVFSALAGVGGIAAVPEVPLAGGWCSKLGQPLLVGAMAPAVRIDGLEVSGYA